MCLHAAIGSLLGIIQVSVTLAPDTEHRSAHYCLRHLSYSRPSWRSASKGPMGVLGCLPTPRLLPPEHPAFSPKLWPLLSSLTGLSLSAPFENIYAGLWGFNSSLACIAIEECSWHSPGKPTSWLLPVGESIPWTRGKLLVIMVSKLCQTIRKDCGGTRAEF